MKVKCIESITYHWGQEFISGKFYYIKDEFEKNVEIIIDSQYWDDSRVIASSGRVIQQFGKGLSDQEIESLIPGYIRALSNYKSKKWIKKITLPFVSISGELTKSNSFCFMSDVEISKRFDIPLIKNKVSFSTTTYRFDDYFKTIQELRSEKLGSLEII